MSSLHAKFGNGQELVGLARYRVAPGLLRVVVLLFMMVLMPTSLRAENNLIMGIHPYLSVPELLKRFTPLADYLGEAIGRPVEVRIGKNYEEHVRYIGLNKLDIAYLGPAPFVKMVEIYGEKPILARLEIKGKPFFQGNIVVHRQSSIKKEADLKGKRFAFGDPGSTMSHLVPRYMLRKAGIDSKTLQAFRFLGSHNNVAMGVLMGDYEAGAVKEEIFYKFKSRGLRVLAATPKISEHLFVTRNGMDGDSIHKLRQALFSLRETDRGRAILRGIKKKMTGMVPAQSTDYDNLRMILNALAKAGIY